MSEEEPLHPNGLEAFEELPDGWVVDIAVEPVGSTTTLDWFMLTVERVGGVLTASNSPPGSLWAPRMRRFGRHVPGLRPFVGQLLPDISAMVEAGLDSERAKALHEALEREYPSL